MLVLAALTLSALCLVLSVEALHLKRSSKPRRTIVSLSMPQSRPINSRGSFTPRMPGRRGDSKRSPSKEKAVSSPPVEKDKADVTVAEDSTKLSAETVIKLCCSTRNAVVASIKWPKGRCEITISDCSARDAPVEERSVSGISSEDLHSLHREIYAKMEQNPDLSRLLQTTEILLATPGVSEVLSCDRDFQTFQAFPVEVHLREEFKKVMKLEGTLVRRDDAFLHISAKGRPISVPRAIIREVRLAPSKYEEADHEMRKLR